MLSEHSYLMIKEQWDEKQENLLAKSPGEFSN